MKRVAKQCETMQPVNALLETMLARITKLRSWVQDDQNWFYNLETKFVDVVETYTEMRDVAATERLARLNAKTEKKELPKNNLNQSIDWTSTVAGVRIVAMDNV